MTGARRWSNSAQTRRTLKTTPRRKPSLTKRYEHATFHDSKRMAACCVGGGDGGGGGGGDSIVFVVVAPTLTLTHRHHFVQRVVRIICVKL